MSNKNAVYQLLPVLNSAELECFGVEDGEPIAGGPTLLDDFFPNDVSTRSWQARRLAPLWKPWKVTNPLPGQINDFPCVGWFVPTFSRRAVAALADLLAGNGELLPVDSDEGPDAYFCYNVTTVADVLDHRASEIEWFATDRLKMKKGIPVDLVTARDIHHYEFHPDRVAPLSIFRLVEMSQDIYVTERFAERIRRNDLKGFNLRKVWPLPKPRYPGGISEMERRAGL